MIAQDILDRARPIIQDLAGVRWTDAELLLYIADAQHQICEVKPAANSTTINHPLVQNVSLQSAPADSKRILRITCNVQNNQRRGSIVLSSRAALDAMDADWHQAKGPEVEMWVYDPEADRGVFWVYPSVNRATSVEMTHQKRPSGPAAVGETLELPDEYINPIADWVCYRAFSKDADYASPSARAMQHLNAFATALGQKAQVFAATDPNLRRRGGETNGRV